MVVNNRMLMEYLLICIPSFSFTDYLLVEVFMYIKTWGGGGMIQETVQGVI